MSVTLSNQKLQLFYGSLETVAAYSTLVHAEHVVRAEREREREKDDMCMMFSIATNDRTRSSLSSIRGRDELKI